MLLSKWKKIYSYYHTLFRNFDSEAELTRCKTWHLQLLFLRKELDTSLWFRCLEDLTVSTRDIETTSFDPASEFLNHSGRNWRNPDCSFYLPFRGRDRSKCQSSCFWTTVEETGKIQTTVSICQFLCPGLTLYSLNQSSTREKDPMFAQLWEDVSSLASATTVKASKESHAKDLEKLAADRLHVSRLFLSRLFFRYWSIWLLGSWAWLSKTLIIRQRYLDIRGWLSSPSIIKLFEIVDW